MAANVGDKPLMIGLGTIENDAEADERPTVTATTPVAAPIGTATVIDESLQPIGVATVLLNLTVLAP